MKDDWKLDYIAEAKLGPQIFDEAGVQRDHQHYHHGRVWYVDRIVVPRPCVGQVISEAHSNLAFGHC